MKKYRFLYSLVARDSIRKLSPDIKPVLKRELEKLLEDPYLGKELIDDLEGFRSLVIGKYRIIYSIDEDAQELHVHVIGHRRDVYMRFKDLLMDLKKD